MNSAIDYCARMAKVSFTKAEQSFDRAVRQLLIDNLSEIATIVDVAHDKDKKISSEALAELIAKFNKQLQKIRKNDTGLYQKLALSAEDEKRLSKPSTEYIQADWLFMKELKLRIDELKSELYGKGAPDTTQEAQVEKERKRHINKRFNIRDGWLPLK